MENETNENEVQIDLRGIFSYVLHKWWIVLICLVVGLAIGFTWGKLTKEDTYSTQATFVVYYDGGTSLGDQTGEQTKVASILGGCVTFVKQNRFAKAVAEELNNGGEYDITSDVVLKSVDYTYATTEGNFIYITTSASTPEMAYDLMIAVTNIFEDYIKTNYHMAGDSSIIFSLANDIEMPTIPVSNTSVLVSTIVCGLVLAVLCIVVFAIIVIADQRVKGEEDLVNRYNIAVIGTVPNFEDKELIKGGYYYAKEEKE